MKLSNYEKETIFLSNEAEPAASVFTYNVALQKQLAALCGSHPEQVHCTDDNEHGELTFELPKKWIKISPPQVLPQLQREVLDRMNRKHWENKD